ncbi:alpha/beta hydrolase [Paenibacillus sediminis]|uniref:Pimeloyl-ACP methyl ester carboxylesterase n=1 Tax=Paenibacillus sediminis TaxID=664909 RepID=A0ABS4H3D8_9BACL|nr:alpha/beta hydrolase [Paenibacillus sediminis]MBP1937038.1 pimeloyl-ACP methyl ester carboxylesterase [Paenibacillus sediminis]
MIENTIILPDGRQMGYAEYGRKDGTPIIAMHGTPGARVSAFYSLLDQIAQNPSVQALRILAIERPGYGLSDPSPERTIGTVVQDTIHFADALGLERFGLFAGSGGAPYALACSYQFPDRVSKTAITAGLGPVYLPEFREGLSAEEQALLHASVFAPESISAFTGKAQADPAAFVEQFLIHMPEEERLQVPASLHSAFIQMVAESTKRPDGMIDDYRSFLQPWNIVFEDIRIPVKFWHSDEDRVVPISHAEHLTDTIPGAALARMHGLSHLTTSLAVAFEVLTFLNEE